MKITIGRTTEDSMHRVNQVVMRIRYWLIEVLAGDMPVVINIAITRPKGFEGLAFMYKPGLPGMFINNLILGEPRAELLYPKRDKVTPKIGVGVAGG